MRVKIYFFYVILKLLELIRKTEILKGAFTYESGNTHLVVEMLLRHIRQRGLAPERTLLGTCLVERQSVRRLEPAEPEPGAGS